MLNFKEIEISDKKWITDLLKASDFIGCEYSFANNMAWRRLNNSLITRYKDFYITGAPYAENPYFTYPAGNGDVFEVIDVLKKYCEENATKLVITSVTENNLEMLKERYCDTIKITTNPDYYDYIYNASDLIELKGKKFHGKRNHIRRFKENNNWKFVSLTPDLFDACIEFSVSSYNKSNGYDDFSAVCEQYAIHTFFKFYDELGLKGGVLYANDKIAGFTIGERLNSDTFVVHIEKALNELQGAYPTLCNEFAKTFPNEIKYVNREEDLGIEGLRKSKKSYNPVFLLKKYTVTFEK